MTPLAHSTVAWWSDRPALARIPQYLHAANGGQTPVMVWLQGGFASGSGGWGW